MKIVFNGSPVAYPMSGVGQYTLQLGRALEDLLGPENIVWFGTHSSGHTSPSLQQRSPGFFSNIHHRMKNGLRTIPYLNTGLYLWRNRRFASKVRREMPCLYHETKYTPFDFHNGPTVVSLYDLSFIRHPEWHPRDRVRHFERYCLRQLSHVEAIITISEFSKSEIVDLLNIDPRNIHVTFLGVDRTFINGKKRGTTGLPDRYILYVGNLEPRKNLPTVLEAYQSLPQRIRDYYVFVVAGMNPWHSKIMSRDLLPFRRDKNIIWTGYIPQIRLPDLYRGATLFVYPSFYEGFGLPVLEAMAAGVPVVASNMTSIPEVVGDSGLLVSPYDVQEWKKTMTMVLGDEDMRKALSERGRRRADLFSWARCARDTVSVYEKLLDKRR